MPACMLMQQQWLGFGIISSEAIIPNPSHCCCSYGKSVTNRISLISCRSAESCRSCTTVAIGNASQYPLLCNDPYNCTIIQQCMIVNSNCRTVSVSTVAAGSSSSCPYVGTGNALPISRHCSEQPGNPIEISEGTQFTRSYPRTLKATPHNQIWQLKILPVSLQDIPMLSQKMLTTSLTPKAPRHSQPGKSRQV